MSLVVASGQYTILDLNDAISGATPPQNPTEGTLWMDTSGEKNVLKQWDDSIHAWVEVNLSLEDLDPSTWEDLEEVKQDIDDMAADSLITPSEKVFVKEKLINITGNMAFTNTLPDVTAIDAGKAGEVYGVRLEATNAGVSSAHGDYTNLVTRYNSLKSYLESLVPCVWDATTEKTNITASVWNTYWKAYYDAVLKLRQTLVAQQQANTKEAEDLAKRLSTRGLALKDGYSAYATTASGQIYFHGYDDRGNPADVDPYLVINGKNQVIRRGTLNPGAVFDIGYLMYDAVNTCWYLIRTEQGVWKKYNVGKTGHSQPFFFDDANNYIVGMLTEG